MRIEVILGTPNVLRFPIERRARPTLALLREIAPDVREVQNIAEAFGMEPPAHGVREQVDAATAEHIADQVPTSGPGRAAMLTGLLDPVIAAAVAACRASHDAWLEAVEAQQALLRAQSGELFWIEPLRERGVAKSGCHGMDAPKPMPSSASPRPAEINGNKAVRHPGRRAGIGPRASRRGGRAACSAGPGTHRVVRPGHAPHAG